MAVPFGGKLSREGACSMRILVIEDNHRLSSSLQMNLAHEGYIDVSIHRLRRKLRILSQGNY